MSETVDDLVMNTTQLTDAAYLVQTNSDVILDHGGVCTKLAFRSVEQMSLDYFFTHEVNKHKGNNDVLYAMQDSVSGAYTLILGDKVYKYTLRQIQQCSVDEIINLLVQNKPKIIAPNLPYVLIARCEGPEGKMITVYLPETKRAYKSALYKLDTHIYVPPCWFSVRINGAGTPVGTKVAAVKGIDLDWQDTKLYRMPLPNVHGDGSICFGSSRIVSVDSREDEKTEAEIIMFQIVQYFDSDFNNHLTSCVNRVLSENDYKTAPRKAYYDGLLAARRNISDDIEMLKVLAVLEEPGGWRKLRLHDLQVKDVNSFVTL